VKVILVVAESMNKDIVPFDTSDSVFNENAYLTQDSVFSLLLISQLWIRILFALARFFVRQGKVVSLIVGLKAKIVWVSKHEEVGKPIQIWWKFLFQHLVVVIAACESAPHEKNHLVNGRNHRVFHCMPFFLPL
jgi:hypothetical protein